MAHLPLRPLRTTGTLKVASDIGVCRLEGLDVERVGFTTALRLWPGDSGDLMCELPGNPSNQLFGFHVSTVAEISPRTWRVMGRLTGLKPEAREAIERWLHPDGVPQTRPSTDSRPLTDPRPVGPPRVLGAEPRVPTNPSISRPAPPRSTEPPPPPATNTVRLVTADWRARSIQVSWPTREVLAGEWRNGLRSGGLNVPAPSPAPPVGMALSLILQPPEGGSIRTHGSVGAVVGRSVLVQVNLTGTEMRRIQALAGV